VIVLMHVATGGLAGALSGSRLAALAVGPVLHALGDAVPHRDFPSRMFETATGTAGLALIAISRGPFDAATIGAVAASVPDIEHLAPPRPGRRKLFPSHRIAGWHREDGISAEAQLVLAVAVLALMLRR
jgi:hypothetical protein